MSFSPFIFPPLSPLCAYAAVLVRAPRKRRGRRRSTYSGIMSGVKNRLLIPAPFLFVALLSTESPSLRLQHVTHVLTKQLSIAEVSTKIATSVDESLSKQQKALFLRQQLAVINAELQHLEPANARLHGSGNIAEDEDDLDVLIHRVDAPPSVTEVRRVASTEARRLKRIPLRNAEHDVARNYVRTCVFVTHVSCLTPCPARMAYRSALDPTTTWFRCPCEA